MSVMFCMFLDFQMFWHFPIYWRFTFKVQLQLKFFPAHSTQPKEMFWGEFKFIYRPKCERDVLGRPPNLNLFIACLGSRLAKEINFPLGCWCPQEAETQEMCAQHTVLALRKEIHLMGICLFKERFVQYKSKLFGKDSLVVQERKRMFGCKSKKWKLRAMEGLWLICWSWRWKGAERPPTEPIPTRSSIFCQSMQALQGGSSRWMTMCQKNATFS